jgi:hypothetical protein
LEGSKNRRAIVRFFPTNFSARCGEVLWSVTAG